MKRIVLALVCLFAAGSLAAQTYACQFIMTAGMDKDPKSGWIMKSFEVDEPFFLTLANGLIDTKSIVEKPLNFLGATCSRLGFEDPFIGNSHWCADFSKYVSFSERNLNGGLAITTGALQSSSDATPDSVAVSRFKCQKVR